MEHTTKKIEGNTTKNVEKWAQQSTKWVKKLYAGDSTFLFNSRFCRPYYFTSCAIIILIKVILENPSFSVNRDYMQFSTF